MTQRKTSNAERPGLPGLSKFNDVVAAYSSVWDRHVQALNEVWTDCTCPEATASDWPKAWSKLLQTWSDNAQDICNLYMSHEGVSAGAGSPFVTFVIDQSADTDAQPQTVPLPTGVDPDKLIATPLVSIEDRRPSEVYRPPIEDAVIPLQVDDGIEIRIAVPQDVDPVGRYLSVVYERKAGDLTNLATNPSNPPPRPVIATVLVLFIPSPI